MSLDPNRNTVVTEDGSRLAVFTTAPNGLPDGGPTIVLSHGWTLDHRSWDPVVERLSHADGVRVVTWDQRGHGASTFAAGGRRPGSPTVRALGDDLLAVLDQSVPQGSPIVLGGHSMGGMTVMALAGLHPELFGERVVGAALVSTSSGNLRGFKVPGEKYLVRALSHVPLRPGRLVTTASQRRGGFGIHPRDEDVRAARDQIAGTRISTIGAFYSALMAHDERAALAALSQVPVRILVGSRDLLTPKRHALALAEAMPDAQLDILDGFGHMLTYEAPDEVCAVLTSLLPEGR